jgi:hypothetical protein
MLTLHVPDLSPNLSCGELVCLLNSLSVGEWSLWTYANLKILCVCQKVVRSWFGWFYLGAHIVACMVIELPPPPG